MITLGANWTVPAIYCRWRLFRTSGGVSSYPIKPPRTLTFINYTVQATSSGAIALILTNVAGGSLSTVTGTNAFLTVWQQ